MRFKKKKLMMILIMCVLSIISAVILAFSVASEVADSSLLDFASDKNGGKDILSEQTGNRKNYLILGTDRASGLTDVMMIISVDSADGRADVVQIPRDTYARYSSGAYRKINGAVSALGGPEKLKDLLCETMCIDIEGYVLFGLDTFVKAIDMVGGVELDLPFDIDYDDPYQNLSIHLDAGRQTLNGKAAEQFVRYRYDYVRGDLGRIDAQKIFMSAFIKKLSEEMTTATFVKTAASMLGEVNTDLGIKDITELAMTLRGISASEITMLTLAGSDIRASSGAWYYVISKSSAEKIAKEHLGADLSGGKFDEGEIFFDPNDSEFSDIYNSDIPYFPITASDVNENGIVIQKQ